MSEIKKLGISGVRSFGPDKMERIDFHSPLTLIQGQNGCGKTTIIESLKYITTAEFPPGCGKGAAFVHDPKMAKESVVRAQIKLQFYNTKRELVRAFRIVEVNQKAKKIEFSTVDTVLSVPGLDGRWINISNKCVDFQAQMTSFLGVAKPILENVIFCHQEDSNWPLDEGKKVKDKFDSIFNASKYIKCLEVIRKLRKDKKQAIGNMQDTVDALKITKEEADRLHNEFNEVKNSLNEVQEEKQSLTKENEPIHRRLNEILKEISEIDSVKNKIDMNENQLSSLQNYQKELKSNQSEKFDCSDAELMNLIQKFEQDTKFRKEKMHQLENNLDKMNREIDRLKREESKTLMVLGKLEAAQKINLQNIKRRDNHLEQCVIKYAVEGHSSRSNFEMHEAQDVYQQLKDNLANQKSNLEQTKRQFEAKEVACHSEIDELRKEEATLKHEISMLLTQAKKLTKESTTLKSTLSSLEKELSAQYYSDVKNDLKIVSEKINELAAKTDTTNLKNEIKTTKEKISVVESELEKVKEEVIRRNRHAEMRSQLNIHIQDKSALEKKNKFIKMKNADDFQIFSSVDKNNDLRSELESKQVEIRIRIKEARDKKSSLEKSRAEISLKVENEKKNIEKRESDIKDFEKKLEEVIDGNDLEAEISRCKEQIDDNIKLISEQESALGMMSRFKEKIVEGQGCPLCHTEFDSETHKEDLIKEIEEKLSRLPFSMKNLKANLSEKEVLHDELLRIRPLKISSDKAREELNVHRSELKHNQTLRENFNKEIKTISVQLNKLNEEEETCHKIQSDVISLDNNMKSIRQLDEKVSYIHSILGTSDDDQNMEDLAAHQSNLEMEMKKLRSHTEDVQQSLLDHHSHMQQLEREKSQHATKLLELERKEVDAKRIKEDLLKFDSEKMKAEEKVEDNRMVLATVDYQLKEKLKDKAEIVSEKNDVIENRNKEMQTIIADISSFESINQSIETYEREMQDTQLLNCRQKVENFQRTCEQNQERKNGIQEEIRSISQSLDLQRERKMNLDNEKKIRDKDVEAEALSQLILSLKERFQRFDREKIQGEKNNLSIVLDRNIKKQSNLEGRLEELKKKEKDLDNNLKRKEIKNAHKNYVEKLIQIKCVDLACKDLNKYYQALDTAVMRFHRDKMAAINSIIRELWRTTYKGNDIDHIEIKTDEVESQGADKRRTYNYRVVMVKNDTEMDMRGRCSAGQKVLASLIIRMALAETFSSNCGILALDEPTTNLDRENIEALSLALLSIVNKRSNQRNFQLIVITHDDDFVERLKRADFIEFYYKVSRNERGLSVIRRYNMSGEEVK